MDRLKPALQWLFVIGLCGCESSEVQTDESTSQAAIPDIPTIEIDLENLPTAEVVALITVDTWRADHFNAELTPTLWKLAEEGQYFTQAYSPMGLTSPSHATMFTGQMPWEHGMEANNHHGYRLDPSTPVLADRFPGFRTGAFVSAYPAGPEGGLSRGWDHFSGPESGERPGWEAVKEAVEWLQVDSPSLLWVHVYEPHGPYIGQGATDRERYAEEVQRSDAILTPLIRLLRARGARIVLASDHGEVLDEEICGRQHERSSSDHVLHVPLVRWDPSGEHQKIRDLVGLDQVPALLSGEKWQTTPVWLAESGTCEPGCNGCSPAGLSGRDRVAIGVSSRLTLRPGSGWLSEGSPPGDWRDRLESIPPLPDPTTEEVIEQGQSLGYFP